MFPFRLSQLGLGVRVGLGGLLLVLLGGLIASSAHMVEHHHTRDERDGMSFDDVVGVYHGIRTEAPLVSALERDHPEGLPASQRQLLLDWLASDQIAEGYDSLELGDDAPAEILDAHCLSCHSGSATEGNGIGKTIPLEYFDEVEKLAISRDVAPVDEAIMLASIHTHALGMGTLSLLFVLLALATRFPGRLVGLLSAACGLGLLADLSSWFLARGSEGFTVLIVAGGGIWMVSCALLGLLSLLELCLPASAQE
jgi:hypothetical protein